MNSINTNRRKFIQQSGAALGGASLSVGARSLLSQDDQVDQNFQHIGNSRVKQLALLAVDAAISAGAVYADVRLTHQKERRFSAALSSMVRNWNSFDSEAMTVGVRSLVDGYWGFASSPFWTQEEMIRLGQASVNLGKYNARGKERYVDMSTRPVVENGHWITPVGINPMDVPREEISDFLASLYRYGKNLDSSFNPIDFTTHSFINQDKAFAASDGSYCTQCLTLSGEIFGGWIYQGKISGNLQEYLSPRGMGWELYKSQPLREHLRALYEELKEDVSYPVKPVDVRRYDTVIAAEVVARLLSSSIGAATQLDRALDYEANSGGTSYINDPAIMLGELGIGGGQLTINASRDTVGGANTVGWDDEGVVPQPFVLIKDGVLNNFQTTRESAGWLNELKPGSNSVFRSNGCAAAPEAMYLPMTHTPNLALVPNSTGTSEVSLISGLKNGILVKSGNISMDFQQLNGYGGINAFEVKNGKRTSRLANAGCLLRAPEFWKSIINIGDSSTMKRFTGNSRKGEPPQDILFSIDAVPVAVRDLTIIDRLRKA